MEDLKYAIFDIFCRLTKDDQMAMELTSLVFGDVLVTLLKDGVPPLFTTEKDNVTAAVLYVLARRLTN